jgi:uncharacterized SAM-binding protein YcdF (DUF218 family)
LTYTAPLLFVCSAIALIGLLRLRSARRRGFVVAGIVAFILVSWPPVEWLASRTLESGYPIGPFRAHPALQAIVVFAENVDPPIFERPYARASQETTDRCEHAAWIYTHVQAMPVLVSGGRQSPRFPPYSETMRELIRRAGVPDASIWTETTSHDTHQNALNSASILRQHGIERVALVVDARCMPRAAACLRKNGIDVTPAPSRFREWGPLREEVLPNWQSVKGNEETLHELLGLVWYWYRGWL